MLEDLFKLKPEDYIQSGRITREGLDELTEWAKRERRLPPDIPDEMLVLFLASCEKDQHLARKTVLSYFRTKNASPDMFGNRDVDLPEIRRNLEVIKILALPARTDCDSAIIMCRLEDPTYSRFDLLSQMKTTAMLADNLMLERNPPEGLTSIVDLDNFTMWLLPKLSLGVLMKFSAYLQEGLPFKISRIYLINCNSLVKPIMKIMQFCMKSELIAKFSIHYKGFDREEFFKNHIPARCMPSDYGGELPSMEKLQESSVQDLRLTKRFFMEEEKLRQKFVTK